MSLEAQKQYYVEMQDVSDETAYNTTYARGFELGAALNDLSLIMAASVFCHIPEILARHNKLLRHLKMTAEEIQRIYPR